MSKTQRVLVCAAVVAVALGFATAVSARPPDCYSSCTCWSSCGQLCSIGSWVTTCGEEFICVEYCLTAPAPESTAVTPVVAAAECEVEAFTPQALVEEALRPVPSGTAVVE